MRRALVTFILALVLLALLGGVGQAFVDVPLSQPELFGATWLLQVRGIIVGYEDGTYRPWEPITRREFSKLAYRLGWQINPLWINDHTDMYRQEVSDYYGGLTWTKGTDGRLTRGQAAILLSRLWPISEHPIWYRDPCVGKGKLSHTTEMVWLAVKYWPSVRFLGGAASSGHIDNSDHYKRPAKAVDIAASKPVMRQIAAYAVAHAKELRVKYVIHNRRIWSRTYPYWRPYYGRSPHTNHVHISTF